MSSVLRSALIRVVARAASALACLGMLACSNANQRGPALESSRRVLNTTRRFATQLVTLKASESTVVTTPEHPFARRGSSWTPAIRLAAGDQLERRGSAGAALLGIEVREVPPTPVYNLTVAKTHSYFVSSQDLLVHNDCAAKRPTLGELLEQERKTESRRPTADRPMLRDLLRVEREAELRKRRDSIMNDTGGWGNCAHCTIAALSDADKLTAFIFEHSNNHKFVNSLEDGMHEGEAHQHLKELGLIGRTTPARKIFPPLREEEGALMRAARDSRDPNFPLWPQVTEFMQQSPSNTFYVEVGFWGPLGPEVHALLAVRDVDGSIKYIDMQLNPPRVVDLSPLRVFRFDVAPTDVDWRFTNKIHRVVASDQPAVPITDPLL